jgi:hypothetical protein
LGDLDIPILTAPTLLLPPHVEGLATSEVLYPCRTSLCETMIKQSAMFRTHMYLDKVVIAQLIVSNGFTQSDRSVGEYIPKGGIRYTSSGQTPRFPTHSPFQTGPYRQQVRKSRYDWSVCIDDAKSSTRQDPRRSDRRSSTDVVREKRR